MVLLAPFYLPWWFLLVSLPLLVVSAAPVVLAPAAFVSLAVGRALWTVDSTM